VTGVGSPTVRVVGLDPSLASFGVATISTNPTSTQITTDQLHTHPDTGIFFRLDYLHERVLQVTAGADLVVIEGLAFSRVTGMAAERAGLWWLLAHRLWFDGTPTAVVGPRARAKYATGNGNSKKPDVVAAMRLRFPRTHLAGNDAADALVLASMGCRALGQPVDFGVDAKCMASFNAVRWPTQRDRFPIYQEAS